MLDQPVNDPPAKLVLLALAAHDIPGGHGIYPSLDHLAKRTGLSRQGVVNALARLRKAGWLDWRNTRRGGRQSVNRYVILQPGLQSQAGVLSQSQRA